MPSNYMRQNSLCIGFSLLELSIVLVIISFVLGAGLSMGNRYLQKDKASITNDRLAKIQAALEVFVKTNGFYPCPARMDAISATAGTGSVFGIRQACTGDVTGVTEIPNAGTNTARAGAVPVKSINLSAEYAQDAWGNKIIYTMTSNLGDAAFVSGGATGAITVQDGSSNVITSTAAYTLVAPGQNRVGATPNRGSAVTKTCGSGTGLDVESCDNDLIFISANYNANNAAGANYYDDYIAYTDGVAGVSSGTKTCTPSTVYYHSSPLACPVSGASATTALGNALSAMWNGKSLTLVTVKSGQVRYWAITGLRPSATPTEILVHDLVVSQPMALVNCDTWQIMATDCMVR